MTNPALIMAGVALITGLYGVYRQHQDAAERKRAATAEREQAGSQLGFAERQWIMQEVRADNDRLRLENAELRADVQTLTHRFDELETKWTRTEAKNERLQAHVDRCDQDNERLSLELAELRQGGR